MSHVYQFEAESLAGRPVPLSQFRGKVLLIVNTASECGFTPQYAGLQALQETYAGQDFDVLGFPATSSANRSRATQNRSRNSATRASASVSRCSPRSTSRGRLPTRCTAG